MIEIQFHFVQAQRFFKYILVYWREHFNDTKQKYWFYASKKRNSFLTFVYYNLK